MIKFSTILAAGILALNATVAMAAPDVTTMEHQGVRYTYTVEQNGEGRTIRGTTNTSTKPFVLYVSKRTVTGTIDGNPVEFSLRDVKRLRGVVEVAAR
jgi:hypothetical protein